jgi:hypothetical protein
MDELSLDDLDLMLSESEINSSGVRESMKSFAEVYLENQRRTSEEIKSMQLSDEDWSRRFG